MRPRGKRVDLEKKIVSLNRLVQLLRRLRAHKKKIVFTNGCFDLIHYGHVKYLQDARNKGDLLVVALNSDASVRRIKGKTRPIVGEHDRLRVLAALESVDFVVLFNDTTPLRTIETIKPDVLVKGADWKKSAIVGKDSVESRGGNVVTVTLMPGRSTSELIKKIVKTH